MKFVLWKCDWCIREEQVAHGHEPLGWAERVGKTSILKKDDTKNIKWYEPEECKLIFCSATCNQAHKDMDIEATKASHEAWLTVYNRRKA